MAHPATPPGPIPARRRGKSKRNILILLTLATLPGGPAIPAVLSWAIDDDPGRPLALLLHGFPDTAHTWRHLGPGLAADGYRVIAPFARGYAPSPVPHDRCYQVEALVQDVLTLHRKNGGDHRAVLVGHDWGAVTANALAASSANPFAAIVSIAVPPMSILRPRRDRLGTWVHAATRQSVMSWYALFHQLPLVPERSLERLVPYLWRRWSPGYDVGEDLAHVARALPDRHHRKAVIDYYRDRFRPWRKPTHLRGAGADTDPAPILYLHGADDGCVHAGWAERFGDLLPAGSRVEVVPDAGHFVHLENPDLVHRLVAEFLTARASTL